MHWLRFIVAALVLLNCTGFAQAQFVPTTETPSTTVPGDPSPNDVKEFLRLLGDPAIQAWLQTSANADGTLDSASTLTLREQFDELVGRTTERAQSLVLAWISLPQMPATVANVWSSELSHAQKVRSVTYILIFLSIGLGLEWLYRQALRYPLLRIEQSPKDAPSQKFAGAVLRAAIIFAGLGIFAIGSIGAFDSFDWHPLVEAIVLDLLLSVLFFRVLTTVSLFFQAPRAPELRLVPYGTKAAVFLHRIVCIMALAIVTAFALSYMLDHFVQHGAGIDQDFAAVALAQTVALAFFVVLVTWACIWVTFKRLPHLCNIDATPRTVQLWCNFLIVLVGVVFALWLAGLFNAMWAVLIVGLAVPGLKLMRAWIDHFFDQSTKAIHDTHIEAAQASLNAFEDAISKGELLEGEAQPNVPEFADPYVSTRPIVQRAARFVFIMSAVLLLSSAWGVNIFDLSA